LKNLDATQTIRIRSHDHVFMPLTLRPLIVVCCVALDSYATEQLSLQKETFSFKLSYT